MLFGSLSSTRRGVTTQSIEIKMATRSEKERQKAQQEKFQAILSNLLKDDDNKYCVDCDAKGPRWASWNLGIFLCIRCAGIHRNLGVHISKVKSVNLDTWTPEQIAMMMEVGNSRARAAYEADLPDNYRRPQTDSALESFIRAKYESKKYMAREWVQPKPSVPRELLEDDKDRKKLKNKGSAGNLQLNSVPRSQAGPTHTEPKTTTSKPVENKPVQAKPNPPQQTRAPPAASSNTADLIGLDFAQKPPADLVDAPVSPVHNNSNSLLGDLNDFMGAPPAQSTAQPATNQVSNGGSDLNLFGEPAESAEKPGEKVSTKDSIMALFGGQQTQQTQFGVPGGMYMPQQQQAPQQQNAGQMYPMQMNNMQQMQMNQQGMYGNQMGMMGMPQGNMGMPGMGMPQQPQIGMPQQGMGQMNPQGNMGMPGSQQMQQAQYQQMQQQMNNMSLGQPGQQFGSGAGMGGVGMMPSGIPAGQGWGGQTSGHTLSTNLWQ